MKAFCDAAVDRAQEVRTRATEAEQAEDVETFRVELVGFYEDSARRIERFVAELENLGRHQARTARSCSTGW